MELKLINWTKSLSLSLLFFMICISICHGQYNAQELIDYSIQYHDPKGLLEKKETVFYFTETRPNGSDRKTVIKLHPAKEAFEMNRSVEKSIIITKLKKGQYSHMVNGQSPSDDDVKKYRLSDERSDMMRTYYNYLWYMPMKLKDPGTIIHNNVDQVDFFGKQALQIKATYDPTVGDDIWYFYFDPMSYALIGYRFYHDESANDGEYILFEGEATYQSIRLPKNRTWYTHNEDKLLGTDTLDRLLVK